eukprot:2086698-Pyramimonas_sp.AAC.2
MEGALETFGLSKSGGGQSSGIPRLSEEQLRIKEERFQTRGQYRRRDVAKEVRKSSLKRWRRVHHDTSRSQLWCLNREG